MATIPWVRYEDDSGVFTSNYFPVRTLIRQAEDEGGAWKVAYNEEEKRRFKAILCSKKKPRTYSRIREERKKAEREGTRLTADNFTEDEPEEIQLLDGFFLMKHCCVEDPSDLCSVNISGKQLSEVKEEDLTLFDNVVYVNAGENYLPFEAFRGFPMIQELEIPLNGLRGIKISPTDFPYLEVVDMSYNNISHDDILCLGKLPSVKVLHLTGNNLKNLPQNMGHPFFDSVSQCQVFRFAKLEVLMLDDNKLSDLSLFAALAALVRLQHLSLQKNEVFYVPQLKSMEGRVVTNTDDKARRRLKRSADKSLQLLKKSVGKSEQSSIQDEAIQKSKDFEDLKVENWAPTSSVVQEVTKVPHNSANKSKEEELNPMDQTETEVLADTTEEPANLTTEDLINLDGQIAALNNEGTDLTEDLSGEKNEGGACLPPFPELRHVNLAHNKIVDEEALLAVAAWPLLVELIIHNNPLTTENSGDPPLLKRFLHDRLGVKLVRKKETSEAKPGIEVHQRRSRKVSSVVSKIPKITVDHLLMLGPPHPSAESKVSSNRQHSSPRPSKPLPSLPIMEEAPRQEPDMGYVPEIPLKEVHEGRRQKKKVAVPEPTDSGEAFFMTQVKEQIEDKDDDNRLVELSETKVRVDDKYKGYEILLDVEECAMENSPPKDIQTNIRALKYALEHELVYRDHAVQLHRVQKAVEPYRKTEMPPRPLLKTRVEKVDEAMLNLRKRTTVTEATLSEVLQDRKFREKEFPEATNLLQQIQTRYNTVRVNSMKEAKQGKKLMRDAMKNVSKTADDLDDKSRRRTKTRAVV